MGNRYVYVSRMMFIDTFSQLSFNIRASLEHYYIVL